MAASLFIGRWDPLHKGHIDIITQVLEEGRDVVIAIRDVPVGYDNPSSTGQKWDRIARAFAEWGPRVKIIVVPDVDEVCHGRTPGWRVRQIDGEFPHVSGTQQRAAGRKVIWLTGQSGAGKTTLAKRFCEATAGIMLDGDEMRASISEEGFGRKDRERHNLRVARLAKELSRQRHVVISVIAPFADVRRKIDAICSPYWIFLDRNAEATKDRPYERPLDPCLVLGGSIEGNFAELMEWWQNGVR